MRDSADSVIPIVGIGASAGGLEALRALTAAIPRHSGACYVVMQHFAPDQKSVMDQLLQAETDIPVAQIEDGDHVRAGRVYVVPPGMTLTVEHDRFRLTPREGDGHLHRPIDSFFASLADARGRDAYCVVLSGSGSDGAEGLRAVKSAGGFALVQESASARFPGMPDSAVATGLVDFVLPAERIVERLQEIMSHRAALQGDTARDRLQDAIKNNIERITERLAAVSGNDFSDYKPGTLVRRIERRMALLRIADLDRFLALLDEDEAQARILAQEFLIGVTQFFRDPASFEALREKVLCQIVARDQRNIRVWVPGCSTGEEVYSLAILLNEELERAEGRQVLQLFGTDIDSPALMAARGGLYTSAALERIPRDLRDKYFTPENGQFRAVPSLRECCVFAPHNLVQDPPFSRLDLISCRNLLIYMTSDLQARVMPRLHFSLKPEGVLFLGPSEGISGGDDLFRTLDKTHRIFVKNPDAETRYSALRDPLPQKGVSARPWTGGRIASAQIAAPEYSREASAEREFLRQHAAPFALISGDGEVIYLSEKMARFIKPSHGTPSTDIDAYLARELRVPVRAALKEAKDSGANVRSDSVLVEDDGIVRFFDIRLAPTLHDGDQFLLTLNEVNAVDTSSVDVAITARQDIDRDMLEVENFNLRRQLAAALQEFETSGQELKSSNEELLSMNEELQSSNEELETSREELQSINEELETVNAELQENNRQLHRANSDLKNLFDSTDIAVLFLDRAFCVRSYTPATTEIFGIRERDIGRPIFDLSSRFDYPGLKEDAQRVDETLQSLERELNIAATDETFLLRIKPYRTVQNQIDGYVLSFIDITNRKRSENQLIAHEEQMARQYAELENLYDTTPVGLSLMSRDLRWLRINAHLAEINGITAEHYEGKTLRELLPDLADTLEPKYRHVFDTGEAILDTPISGETASQPGVERHWLCDFYPIRSNGEVFAVGTCVREVTEQKRLIDRIEAQSERQTILLRELQHRVKNTLATINAVSKLLLRTASSPEDYQKRLASRLNALARTHDLLTAQEWRTVPLSALVEAELSPYRPEGGAAFTIDGPDVPIAASQAQSLGMAFHELATNSAKYGALSDSEGRIVLKVSETGETVRIEWIETGGPKIEAPPERRGFGSVVLNQVVASDLDGDAQVHYAEEGLRFVLTFPRRHE
ncbi:chemotaxis protein CheB [Marivita sp. GX14005]|uniref:chemotaxis protein CheB n=1 Tax=Marivita sp. GX14005 TaxID=2942276 RepID=UPI002019CFD1|nr:chemotaxis protein CheB [Marivita sp. GX14005]MCL3882883.1 PAS domain-containing protein [Marivita sp. GX14005]